MFNNIIEDILTTWVYWPLAFGVSILCMSAYLVGRKVLGEKVLFEKGLFLTFLWVFYTILIFGVTIFSRAAGSRNAGIDWHLFYNPSGSTINILYWIENLLMFFPYGFLLSQTFPEKIRFREAVLICCFFSIIIETVQYLTGRGYCQLEDVVLNTIGGGAGWFISKAVFHRKRKNQESSESES